MFKQTSMLQKNDHEGLLTITYGKILKDAIIYGFVEKGIE